MLGDIPRSAQALTHVGQDFKYSPSRYRFGSLVRRVLVFEAYHFLLRDANMGEGEINLSACSYLYPSQVGEDSPADDGRLDGKIETPVVVIKAESKEYLKGDGDAMLSSSPFSKDVCSHPMRSRSFPRPPTYSLLQRTASVN